MNLRIYSIATLLFFAAFHSPAQEAIGTNNPNPQAALHIASPNKGLLIPKLALSNAATFIGPGTDAQSDTGMLVFNTNTDTNGTGLNGSGFYYWSTNSWEKLSGLTELNDKTTHVPLWVSNTNGGAYARFDVVSWIGVLYKNRTGTNTDSSPNADATNWTRVDQDLGNIVSVGRGILIRPNWPSVGWNLRVDENGADTFYTSNPSYRIIEELDGTNAGNLLIRGTTTGTAGEKRSTVPEVVHATFSPDSNLRLGGDLNTDTFSTAWQSDTDGGTYLINAIVAYNGVFYKNRSGTNTDTAPDGDAINWRRADQDLGNIVSVGGGVLVRPNWPSVGWNLSVDDDGDDTFFTSNPSYKIEEALAGVNAGNLVIKGTLTGTAGEKTGTVSEVVHATFSPDSNLRLGGNLHTNAFSTNWQSDTDGGSYLTNAIIAYNGVFYRNRTGTNTDTAPDGDATNWEATGGGDVMPLWKSNTNGGTYTTNDLVNYGGVLYKNLTGTNTDTSPDGDATNWTSIGGGAGGDGAFEYMVAKYSSSSFSVTNGMTFPYNTVLASEGSSITNTNGVFTLKAGSTYKLTADIGRLAGSGYVAWRWYNDTTNAWIDTSSTAQQWGSNYGASYTDSGSVFAIITPTVDTNVRVRQSSGTTSATQNTESTYGTARAFIEVMNVTNYSYGGTGLMIYDVNKDYILNDTIEKGGLLYKANGNIPAGTTFAEGTTGATWTALTAIAPSSDPVWVANETVSAGDIRVHNGIRYTNLTNTNTATNPNDDILNWERADQTYDRVLSPAKLQRGRGTESITLGDDSTTSFSNVLFAGGRMNGSGTQYVFYLNQNGNVSKSGGGSWASTSDERTKKDIKDFNVGLEEIIKLRPVRFKYNGKYDTPTDEKEYVSFIAQEVEKIAPRMINRIDIPGSDAVGENALKLLENSDFVPMLVNAVQELKQKNDALEARIKALESAMEPKQ